MYTYISNIKPATTYQNILDNRQQLNHTDNSDHKYFFYENFILENYYYKTMILNSDENKLVMLWLSCYSFFFIDHFLKCNRELMLVG